MDEMVFQAQQWVNSTHRNVSGFVPVQEDGITGWKTMYALTRALQHELGITTLSDGFGPQTLSKLEARGGGVPLGETNRNIIKIIQCGCYCKGYNGGGLSGTFDTSTVGGLQVLMNDCGIDQSRNPANTVPSKVVKALLTMDAYRIVGGGTEAVRSVQRWLNFRYTQRANFFIGPCDGVFSRDVQKALYLAIQFELGMTDSQATGVFGPGTQAGLKSHQLAAGSSGIFVRIFTAAMICNRIWIGASTVFEKFTDTFDADVVSAAKTFQKFSEISVTGNGDFTTWCQLLVSTGDPNRPCKAIDAISEITQPRAEMLKAAGYTMVGRYLDERPSSHPLNKQIQTGELAVIFRNGLRVFPISQYYGGEASYFTYAQGVTDAEGAHEAAVRYGFNPGVVIYFAVDFDATQTDIDRAVIPYFQGVVTGLAIRGRRYIHGVYGARNVCAEVTRRTMARWSFVSGMSTGFSGNLGFPLPDNWSLNQIQTATLGSGSAQIEVDRVAYRATTDPGVSSVNDPADPVDTFIAYLKKLYDLARAYGVGDPNTRVLEYLRHREYNGPTWKALIGGVDDAFVDYVNQTQLTMVERLRDPGYGIDVGIGHLGATCNAVYLRGKPSGPVLLTDVGDVAGWGGDLMTFYGEWRRDSDTYASGLTYCQQNLAKIGDRGTFKLNDLIEDVDGYNIAMKIRQGVNVVDAMEANYRGEYLGRVGKFLAGRFGDQAKALAKDMLTSLVEPVIVSGRTLLIETTAGTAVMLPVAMPSSVLDPFCEGFAAMLAERAAQEAS